MSDLTPLELQSLSDRIEAMSVTLAEGLEFGTLEQWNAVQSLSDAARDLYSAGAWLMRHDEKYEK